MASDAIDFGIVKTVDDDLVIGTQEPKLRAHGAGGAALRAGSPRVEAQRRDTTKYSLVTIEHMALRWQYRRDLRRLAILDREGRELAVYYNPRIVAGRQEQVVAWVAAELEAGKTVKPDEPDTRARCSNAIGFEVGRQMLRNACRKFAARGRGRPRNREKPSN
jgi:hypothetical protein